VAEVTLSIGGHHYALTCADGEEAELQRLGALVDEQVQAARSAVGGLTEVRQLLFASLFLADRIGTPPPSAPAADNGVAAARIDAMTARIDQLATRLRGA
jgi:cell division protein ZapA